MAKRFVLFSNRLVVLAVFVQLVSVSCLAGFVNEIAGQFQVFFVVGNAVKFTDEGGIALRIGARLNVDGRKELLFEVEDTGPGIGEDEKERLFQAFEQTRAGLRSGGTGLGLAIVKSIAEKHGGQVWAESQLGKGSVFYLSIPLRQPVSQQES